MGPAHSDRCLAELARAGGALAALGGFEPTAAARADWPSLVELVAALASPAAAWPGQAERVRDWYRPHLERQYDAAAVRAGDLEQLVRIAGGYATRERFLTELALDPPQASGDRSGPPLLDEDYLVLSTVHSAKGQEWQSVYVLNVNDGNFPSEFAAGAPELLEEERRLLYVAMTRAKDELRLLAPVRFYVTQQSPTGDRYVHGARSRFLTEAVLARFSRVTWPEGTEPRPAIAAEAGNRIDVATRLRNMW
jgi:DNA helicase-2/ATP-dependent DNA helicase PcrA